MVGYDNWLNIRKLYEIKYFVIIPFSTKVRVTTIGLLTIELYRSVVYDQSVRYRNRCSGNMMVHNILLGAMHRAGKL